MFKLLDTIMGSFLILPIIVAFAIGVILWITIQPAFYANIPRHGIDSGKINDLEKARKTWITDGKTIINQGLKKFSGCFQVYTESGPKIIIPDRYVDEIRNHPHLHFFKAVQAELFGKYPGLQPFAVNHNIDIITQTVRGKLTQSLSLITDELMDETANAVLEAFGEPQGMNRPVFVINNFMVPPHNLN
jgi:hypothetical protein